VIEEFIMNLYQLLIKPLLFSLDPETSHELVIKLGKLAEFSPIRSCLSSMYSFSDPRLEVQVAGLSFPNPVGLAAGVDKSCRAIHMFSALGPGAIEIGVISAKPQPGNERPRIYRFPEQSALINRMGNPNIGADAAQVRLQWLRESTKRANITLPPIGLNIGKTTVTPIEEAAGDCAYTLSKLGEFVDYIIINVSCPNVTDYSKLQERSALTDLLKALNEANKFKRKIFVKLAPDLTEEQSDEALSVCSEQNIAGIIATNTSLARDGLPSSAPSQGGMSGKPLFPKSLSTVKFLAQKINGKFPLIGVGGIANADDVISMMKAGACMVELYTALIYQGPSLIKKIKMDLLTQMDRDGVRTVSEYIGAT